jgi:hypothetical protein
MFGTFKFVRFEFTAEQPSSARPNTVAAIACDILMSALSARNAARNVANEVRSGSCAAWCGTPGYIASYHGAMVVPNPNWRVQSQKRIINPERITNPGNRDDLDNGT